MSKLSGMALATALLWTAPAWAAAPQQDPDWPCVQAKVPELSPVAIWSGPSIDDAFEAWDRDPQVAALVAKLAPRRTPIEEAAAAISGFAKQLDPAKRPEKLGMLFAGLFETLDRERTEVMEGIGRYARRQKAMAEELRQAMAKAQDPSLAADPQQASQYNDQLVWQTRIFNERRASLSFVCEVPTIIEQRLFALGRTIAGEIAN